MQTDSKLSIIKEWPNTYLSGILDIGKLYITVIWLAKRRML
jgi:hypothetical protein